jgi:hypothetical protein
LPPEDADIEHESEVDDDHRGPWLPPPVPQHRASSVYWYEGRPEFVEEEDYHYCSMTRTIFEPDDDHDDERRWYPY